MTALQERTITLLRVEPLATIEEIAMTLGSSREYISKIANKHGFTPEVREAARKNQMKKYEMFAGSR